MHATPGRYLIHTLTALVAFASEPHFNRVLFVVLVRQCSTWTQLAVRTASPLSHQKQWHSEARRLCLTTELIKADGVGSAAVIE